MAASVNVEVSPEVLLWARTSAGFRPGDVAARLKQSEDRVRAWEAGDEAPTLAQLRGLADMYKRPLAVFLLDAPPAEARRPRDFRSRAAASEPSPALLLALREATERRAVALELRDGTSEEIGAFSVQAEPTDDPEVVGGRMREALGVTLEEQRAINTPHASLGRWRSAIEAQGILVFGFRDVAVREARGFSLSDQPLPVIGVNNADSPNGRVFTLLHELTHLALRSGLSLCDLQDDDGPGAAIETFCNHVAGAVLVPREALLRRSEVAAANERTKWSESSVKRLADRFAVSREVVLRRLLILGKTSRAHYREWHKRLAAEYARATESAGGGDYYKTRLSQLGRLYSRLVLGAHARDAITSSTASRYLGVKVDHFERLGRELTMGGR